MPGTLTDPVTHLVFLAGDGPHPDPLLKSHLRLALLPLPLVALPLALDAPVDARAVARWHRADQGSRALGDEIWGSQAEPEGKQIILGYCKEL